MILFASHRYTQDRLPIQSFRSQSLAIANANIRSAVGSMGNDRLWYSRSLPGNAALYASGLSAQLPLQQVLFYHSIEASHLATELRLPSPSESPHLCQASHDRLAALKAELHSRLPEGTPIATHTDARSLKVAARDLADETKADLLVLGTTRRRGLAHLVYESPVSLLAVDARLFILNVFQEDNAGEPDEIMTEQTALHELWMTRTRRSSICQRMGCLYRGCNLKAFIHFSRSSSRTFSTESVIR